MKLFSGMKFLTINLIKYWLVKRKFILMGDFNRDLLQVNIKKTLLEYME